MTLRDKIASLNGVFLDTDRFAELAYHYPAGDVGRRAEVTVIVVEDEEIGSNEVPGDGKVVERREGRMFRHSVIVEIASSVGVSELSRPPDRFRVFDTVADKTAFDAGDTTKGTMFTVKRRLGRDKSMEAWLCVRIDRLSVKGETERG